jgi:hypothetical protein
MRKILLATAAIFIFISSFAQIKELGNKLFKSKANPVGDILKKPAPITTNFGDVKMEGSLPETFGNDKKYFPLYDAKRSENGGFVLCPGYYEMMNMSYCLHAGTHGPSQGDGYMYAPTKGDMEDIVDAVLFAHQTKHPEIDQHDVQLLLWAIISRAKFKNLSSRLKTVATLLLTPEQIVKLNGGYVETLSGEALNKGLINMPAPMRSVMEAENKIRGLVESGVDDYDQFEKLAVLTGIAPNDHPEIHRGIWTLHPDGYYIRYFPQGYSRTKVQIYVPEKKGQITYNAIKTIACPANTNAQRLAQTNMPINKNGDRTVSNPCK